MKHLLGLIVSIGVAGLASIPATALAQAQKVEAPDANAPLKPAPVPRPKIDLEFCRRNLDSVYRPYYVAEYHLIRKVGSLTPEQAKAIARDGERAYRKEVLKAAEELMKEIASVGSFQALRRLEVIHAIRDDLGAIAKSRMEPQQVERLRDEMAKRTAARREIGIETLLDMIDRELILGVGQREEIGRSLASHWEEDWIPWPDLFLHGRMPLPMIPDACIVGFLTENQRKAWREIPKVQAFPLERVMIIGLRGGNPLEDDALREARQAEETARQSEAKEAPR
jgi:hypothetical protein